MATFGSVLITGASSGIGHALALESAAGGVTLHLGGRDPGRLEAVAAACRTRGAIAVPQVVDVTDAADVSAWILGAGRLDLVVANAGIGAGIDGGGPETTAQVRAIFATNLGGVLNTILPAIEAMSGQAAGADGIRGRIVAIASIAAFVPAPGAPSYCASKVAVDAFVVATAESARRVGIAMTSACPGYIGTPMTAGNKFPMPGLMSADRAAGIILRAVAAGRRRVAFPWWMAAAARLTGLLPPRLSGAMLSRPRGKAPLPTAAG